MTRSERLALVDHDDPALPVTAQCRLLKVARSTLYYRPVPVSDDNLATSTPIVVFASRSMHMREFIMLGRPTQ